MGETKVRSERAVPMPPWPALEPFARTVRLAVGGEELFLFDTGTAGRKAPAILIHGLGDEADSWRHLIPLLAPDRRVLAPDLPGFGRSPGHGRISLKRHVAAIIGLLEETPSAVLVGSSMGAAVAELVAFAAPGRVAGLVLLDGGLPSTGSLSPALIRMLTPILGERTYRAFRRDHEAAYRSLAPYYADLAALGEEERTFLRDRVIARVESETQLRAYFASMRSFVATAATGRGRFATSLAAYGGPILLGWGELDQIMPLDGAQTLRAARPDAKLVVFAGAGHLPHQEAPAAVAEAITAFLDAIPDRTA